PQRPGAYLGGAQSGAVVADAPGTLLAVVGVQLWLISVLAQLFDVVSIRVQPLQGRQLCGREAVGGKYQGTGERLTAEQADAGVRLPGLGPGQAAGRDPGGVSGVIRGAGSDLPGDARWTCLHPPTAAGAGAGSAGLQGGGAEQLGWNLQFSAVLWVDGVAHLDDAVANAVDHPFEVAGPAEAFHPGTRYLQPAEAGVVEQGYRMVDTQGQQYLGLYVGILDIHFAVDEHRGQLRALIRSGLGGGQHMQTDRLAAGLAQMHRRYHEEAGTQWPQGNDPAGDRRGAAVHLADQTQLAAALNLEMFTQRAQVQLAESPHGRRF